MNKEAKYKTCEGCEHLKNPQGGYCYMFKEKPENCQLNTCPDCQQPPAGEWTKKIRASIAVSDAFDQTAGKQSNPMITPLLEACKIIDRAEAELKDIKLELSCPETMECAQKKEPLYKWAATIVCAKHELQARLDREKALNKDLLTACDIFQESIYKLSEGLCILCGGEDYPVCGDKKGYDEVDAEDAEEWRLAHKESCPLIIFEAAIAKALKE